MALRWVAAGHRTQLDGFNPTSGLLRFYIDFRQYAYPPLTGTPTFTLITSADNQPGTHNLTGGYAHYLIALTDEVTVRARVKPTFAYDTGDDQPLWSWYVDANRYLTLLYTQADDKFTLKWKDGGTERVLQSAAYTSDEELQVWADIDVSVDLANGTGALFIDRASVDSTWSGATDTKSSYFPKFALRAETTTAGTYTINHVRMFLSKEATSAEVGNNFRDIKTEETYWPLDGHALGRSRTNITRHVTSYDLEAKTENPGSGSQCANTLSLSLLSNAGEFADDQYAAWDPANDVFNGTSGQAYMQARCPVIAETWYGNIFEPFFVGRVDRERFRRNTTDALHRSIVDISCEDFVAEIAETTLAVGKYFSEKKLSDSTEADSLVHLITRLVSQRTIKNYLSNSSFENATIGNSWAVSGGSAPTLTRAAGGLFGSFQGDLDYDDATCTVAQTVTFLGDKKLSVGEKWTFSIYLSSASNCGTNIYLVEADAGGDNDSSTTAWTITGGKGWKRFDVTHTITDSDSDRLIVRVTLDDDVVLSLDAAMLTGTARAVDWFVLNDNDGASAVESADDADSAAYDQVGFDVDAVAVTHPFVVVSEGRPVWEYLKEIADATAAYYMGMDPAGTLRYRTPFKTGYADPTPAVTITAASEMATQIDAAIANKVVIGGVKIVKETAVSEVWNAQASGDFGPKYNSVGELDTGEVWPIVSAGDTVGKDDYWSVYGVVEYKETRDAKAALIAHTPGPRPL